MSPSYHRRDVLRLGGSAAGVVLAGVTAGCGSLDRSPPAGSLVFDNRLSVPEVVTVRITSGPVEIDDPMYLAGANVALDPGERRTVRSVFEKPGTYTVESWIISQNPETTRWGVETAEVDIRSAAGYAEYLHVLLREDAGLLDLRLTAVG